MSQLFEISIRSDEGGSAVERQGRGNTVCVRDFVESFQFSRLNRLGELHAYEFDWKMAERGESLPCRRFTSHVPKAVEDLTPVHDRNSQTGLAASSFADDSFYRRPARTIFAVVQKGVRIEDVRFH